MERKKCARIAENLTTVLKEQGIAAKLNFSLILSVNSGEFFHLLCCFALSNNINVMTLSIINSCVRCAINRCYKQSHDATFFLKNASGSYRIKNR